MPSPIELTLRDPATNTLTTEHFDFLIIACDPRNLPFSTLTPLESLVTTSLTSHTFRTSLYKGRRPKSPQLPNTSPSGPRTNTPNYVVRFDPSPLSSLDGQVYGYRDEVMARDPSYAPSPNGETWLTVYQLDERGLLNRDRNAATAELDAKRDAVIGPRGLPWIDFVPVEEDGGVAQPEVAEIVDYFPHFEKEGLESLLPWRIKEAQGRNFTLYVSAFAAFESVLHVYLYQREIMREDGEVMGKWFPRDKKARIAVVGAGPAGILFAALWLKGRGYENFVVYEKEGRFGGKTMTHRRRAPAEPGRVVPCELGTCYLSLGYEPMFELFERYDAGRIVELDRDGFKFRSIIDEEVAKTQEERENGVEFGSWTRRRNGPVEVVENVRMLKAAVKYVAVHYATMGMGLMDSMPAVPPTKENAGRNLKALVGRVRDRGGEEERGMRFGELFREVMGRKGDWLERLVEEKIEGWVKVGELEKACENVFEMSFAKFLDENGMGVLKSTFVYSYQVQGYGTIEKVPAYYGLVWITPGVLLGEVRGVFDRDPAARERGRVNVLTEGWGRLWEQMVEKEKLGIVFNADIVGIKRRDVM